MPVGEEIPVDPVAGGPFRHPSVRTEKMPFGFIDESPAVAREDAVFQRLFPMRQPFEAQASVEGTGRALEVAGGGHSRFPRARGKADAKVLRCEAAALVGQRHTAGPDGKDAVADGLGKFGNGEIAVDDGQGSPVFEYAVFGPFHADEPVGQDGEAGVLIHDGSGGLCRRIIVFSHCGEGKQKEGEGQDPFHSE